MCKVSFWILFIWVCLIISITLGWVLRQFRFSLRVFNLNSRFFLRDYVKAVFYYFVSLWSFLSFCLDSLHVFIPLPDSVFVKEVNISMLDTVIAILIRLCNSTLSYYVNIIKLICISSILFSIYFQSLWQGEFVKQSRVLKLMIISFILVTFLFYSGLILWGEIRCKSILEFKGLTAKGFVDELDSRSLSISIYTTSEKKGCD